MKYAFALLIGIVVFCGIKWEWTRAAIERFVAPSFGTCYRCHRPWKFVNGHVVWYSRDSGTFPVCEECWKKSTLAELQIYFTECYQDQLSQGMPDDHRQALHDSVEVEYYRTHPNL